MKLIKKIAAIMFAFMMVFSLSTNAKAEEGTTGTITITNAINGQDYSIYKIMTLESYNSEEQLYSYKPASTQWENFFKTDPVAIKYIELNDDNGITWKTQKGAAKDEDDYRTKLEQEAAELAKAAIAYAKDDRNGVAPVTVANSTSQTNEDGTKRLTYSGLELGYYLVDSSVGALCGLTTTNPRIEVEEKNETPVLEKRVNTYTEGYPSFAPESNLVKNTTANFGDRIKFTLTIKNLKGAENLVITDTMDEGLKLYKGEKNNFLVEAFLMSKDKAINGTIYDDGLVQITDLDYELTTSVVENKDSFNIKFNQQAYKKIEEHPDYVLRISYTATVNNNAGINNINNATLKYGHKDTNIITDQAYVGTLNIPVHKYTLKLGEETALPGAEFTLYKDEQCTNAIQFSKLDESSDTYNYNYDQDVTDKATLISGNNGNILIKGLKAGTYYLKETKAPDGYNLLKDKITVTIYPVVDGTNKTITNTKITVNENGVANEYHEVKVRNNSGTLLPSTGGMGTTLIYLIGGALVLGSGFVLANKKRAKAK